MGEYLIQERTAKCIADQIKRISGDNQSLNMAQIAEHLSCIEGSIIEPEGQYSIKAINGLGGVLKEKNLDTGMAFTLPTKVNIAYFDNMSHHGWVAPVPHNNDLIIVEDQPVIAGATYTSTCEDLQISCWCEASSPITFSYSLSGVTLEIDWGDGTVNNELSHTYTTTASYLIKIKFEGLTYAHDLRLFCNSINSSSWCILANPEGYLRNKFQFRDGLLYGAILCQGFTSINGYMFTNCINLSTIVIPNSVTSIGDCAFEDCTSLKTVVWSSNLEQIGTRAFKGCTDLESLYLGEKLTNIGEGAFDNCTNLKQVFLNENNTAFRLVEGVLYDKDITRIIWVSPDIQELDIPATVKTVSSFQNNLSLKTVTFSEGSGITSMPDNAFEGCIGLANISIPDSVTSVGDSAFANCTSLTSITLPEGVTSIGQSAFASCTSLASISIPSSVTDIGAWAFFHCPSLKNAVYQGTAEEWAQVAISGTGNESLTDIITFAK